MDRSQIRRIVLSLSLVLCDTTRQSAKRAPAAASRTRLRIANPRRQSAITAMPRASDPGSSRPSSSGTAWSPTCQSRGHQSPITTHESHAFLIDTLPIRNTSNSFLANKCAHSNRHSSETLARTRFSGKCSHIATRTTPGELPFLPPNLLCYSFLVTRVPPNGLRASAPARSHGCGVDVSLPRNVRTTGAFPHKFNYSTGLMGLAGFVFRDSADAAHFGFRSPESPVGNAGVKENSCES